MNLNRGTFGQVYVIGGTAEQSKGRYQKKLKLEKVLLEPNIIPTKTYHNVRNTKLKLAEAYITSMASVI